MSQSSALLRMAREPHESVVAFLRRLLDDGIERYAKKSMSLAEIGLMAAVRRVFQESPALQVHAAQAARRASDDGEDSFARALAKDVKAKCKRPHPSPRCRSSVRDLFDLVPRSVNGEGEREKSRKRPKTVLRAAAETALRLLEKGIGDYGVKPR